MRAEGFSCSLGVLYGGLGISKLQFLIKKTKIKFLVVNFSILDHKTLDPDPGSGSGIRIRNPDPQLEKMLDPDPYLKELSGGGAGTGAGADIRICGSVEPEP